MLRLTDEQHDAIVKCCEWYYDTSFDKKNYFIVSGYAGTGKTTIIQTLISILGLANYNVLYAAYTGKAALVLRMKGNMANTIHKSFYNIYHSPSGQYGFKVKNSLSTMIKLIVIDEFSMLNDKMINDILSFGLPTIFLGDIGQLPPIIGHNTFLENPENIDAQLTKVIRQEDASGILELATLARNGEEIKPGVYKNSRVLYLKDIKNIEEYDIILCWKNSTRRLFNQAVRKRFGYNSVYPLKGEKVIGLKNNYFHQIDYDGIPIFPVNGLPSICIEDYKPTKEKNLINLKYKPEFIVDDDGESFNTLCRTEYFDSYFKDIDKDLSLLEDDDNVVHLDFGYCLSVYRAQGSQYKRGLLLDEYKGPKDIYNKFVYTGLTRFSNGVDFVKDFSR